MQEENHPSPGSGAENDPSAGRVSWSWHGLPGGGNGPGAGHPLGRHVAMPLADQVDLREIPTRFRLELVPPSSGGGKLVCFTWCHGKAPWIPAFHPHLRAWAARHGVNLQIRREPPDSGTLRTPAFARWLDSFVDGGGDWMIAIDADVMIHPLAPDPLAGGRAPGVWALEQPAQEKIRDGWARWVRQTFQREVNPDFRYRNDGVWLIDRATAVKWRGRAGQLMLPGVDESHYFNLWLHDAAEAGEIVIWDLPQEWNRLPHRPFEVSNDPAWFYHCAGRDKMAGLSSLYLDGLLPQPRPAVTIKPWPPTPELEGVVSMPYHWASDPSKGECLRYALRSIDRHWKHDWPLRVLGTQRPEWLDERVFEHEPSYPLALLKSFRDAGRVLWMNDDILMLKDTCEEDLRVPLRTGDLVPLLPRLLGATNRWDRARGHITGRLHHENALDRLPDFSMHVGYLFERDQARRVFDHFGVWHKFPLEIAYHGLLGSEGRPCDEKAVWKTRDDPAMRWLNVDDKWLEGGEFLAWISSRFPEPSKWEK